MNERIGLIGLGMMGRNLALNLADKGYALSLYNRPESGQVDIAKKFIADNDTLSPAQGFNDLKSFIDSLTRPRTIMILIKAGEPVDQVLEIIRPLLSNDDMIIELGNTHFKDTIRRFNSFEIMGVRYIGAGISGGISGARHGLSIMPGGSKKGYERAEPFLASVAAISAKGSPCVTWVGDNGAGHFVKMIHNGIEYAEMQLIAETYNMLRNGLGYTPDTIAELLTKWTEERDESYLLRITVDILNQKDGEGWLLDRISDQAECKGTGGWSLNTANELKVAVPSIAEALFARFLSSDKQTRTKAQKIYHSGITFPEIDADTIGKALLAARIVNHHQGFQLISKASQAYGWKINLSELALIWTGGCIIQSSLMKKIVEEFSKSSQLLLSPGIIPVIEDLLPAFKDIVTTSLNAGLPVPVFASNLSYLLAFQQGESPANLIQAQRDYFGAHRFQFADDPSGKMIHFNWKKNMD